MTLFPTLDPARCVPCGLCEKACVEARHGDGPWDEVFILEHRRLAVRSDVPFVFGVEPTSAATPTLHACDHCHESPCIPVCPHLALLRFPDGRVDLREDRCTGCGKCVSACPTGGIRRVNQLDVAIKCDGCAPLGVAPACAAACPSGAIAMVAVTR